MLYADGRADHADVLIDVNFRISEDSLRLSNRGDWHR